MNNKEDIIKLIKDLKIPEFENNPEFLKKTISSIDEYSRRQAKGDLDEFRKLANNRIKNIDGIPSPLTKKESLLFDKKLVEVKSKIERIKEKISLAKETISKEVSKEDNHFSLDISKNKSFQIAAKNIFGEDRKEISHEDYLKLIELRNKNSEEEKRSFIDFGDK